MFNALNKLWLTGAPEEPARLRRQVALSNQIGLFGAAATIPYQIFYIFYNFSLYFRLFALNLVFIALYLAVLWVNRAGHHNGARNLVLANACTQILVVTYFISAGAGVHLFYFTLGSVLSLMFFRHRTVTPAVLLALVAGLFLICHFAFPASTALMPIPAGWIEVMFTVSALGALTLTGGFSYLFRLEIDRAEDKLIESNLALEQLSATDQLTGLANRRRLDQFLEQESGRAVREGQPLSVVMADVDFFKAYNDRYGHQQGDGCLRQIAGAMGAVVHRPSDLVARYGGEEFAVILPNTDENGARYMAERIRATIESLAIPHAHSGVAKVVTLSLGVSTLPPGSGAETSDMLSRADEALYRAKSTGRNRIEFQPVGQASGSTE